MSLALTVQGDVMESIGRTWAKKGVLGFFSGNSAGRTQPMLSHHKLAHQKDSRKDLFTQEMNAGVLLVSDAQPALALRACRVPVKLYACCIGA